MTEKFDAYTKMDVKHHFINGVYTKECHLPVGYKFEQHRHTFDHMSILASGTAIIEVDGVETEVTGPAVLNIKARTIHAVTPITPVLWYCIHKTDCTEAEDIDMEFIE